MTHVAIMQPYLFPYLGYYQLVDHVEEFIFFDEVNYIKRGYINRNCIMLQGAEHRFTLPVRSVSQNRSIRDHFFVDDCNDVVAMLARAYGTAPFFKEVFPLVEAVLLAKDRNVAHLTARSITLVHDYLGEPKKFSFSSDAPQEADVKGEARILSLCRHKGARRYTNSIGGRDLYHKAAFASRGIDLEFIAMRGDLCKPVFPAFNPSLSVIDILMQCSKDGIRSLLKQHDIHAACDAAFAIAG